MSDVFFKWLGNVAEEKINEVVAETLWQAGQDAINKAMNDVPLDTGTLRRSGSVTVDRLPDPQLAYEYAVDGRGNRGTTTGKGAESPLSLKSARNIRVYVSYNTPYAIWLHESSKWTPRGWKRTAAGRIVPKPAVGQWKWLSKALVKVNGRWETYVARARRKAGI